MYLVHKENGRVTSRFPIATGPVYVGRGTDCQILLNSGAVSRQHAVIYSADGTEWWLQDLCSANGTSLNGRSIERAKLKNGDRICLGDSTLEVNLSKDAEATQPSHLDDTLADRPHGPRVITRALEFDHAPPIRMPAQRTGDFIRAAGAFGKATGTEETVGAILHVLTQQFAAAHAWCGLRYSPTGPLANCRGTTDANQPFHLQQATLTERIRRVLEERSFLLLPTLHESKTQGAAGSAMMAPLVGSAGNYGVLYLDNHAHHEPYQVGDLDYLMLLALHLGAVLEDY